MEADLVRQTLVDSLLPGDVLLYSRKNPVSLLIRIKTWSRFSHCEFYLGSGLSAAARSHGVNTYLLDNSFTAILRPEVPQHHYLDIQPAREYHKSCIGQHYDTLGLFRFFTIGKQTTNKSFCSEHVTRILRHCLICHPDYPELKSAFKPFQEKYDADLVSPGMFYSTPHLAVVWEDKGSVDLG